MREKINNIKLFACDVDGTLTDGSCWVDKYGNEVKKFHVKDGMATRFLQEKGIIHGFITGSSEPCIRKRSEKLKTDFYFEAAHNKIEIIHLLMKQYNLSINEIAYMGDDVNDLEVVQSVGLSFCPSDAEEIIKENVDYVINRKGGEAAFRKAVDFILGEELKFS